MADFTATFVDHSELLPLVTYAIEQQYWVGTEQATFVAHDIIGVIQTPAIGILWPPR